MGIEKLLESLKDRLIYEELDLKQLINENGSQQVVKMILDNVGNTHSLIRENMMGIHDRLVEEGHCSKDECIHLFSTSLRNLSKGLGSKADDLVFCRAFSSLYVAFIVDIDEKLNLLSQEQYMMALEKGIDYMMQEVDRRGFVKGKGWAHALAHGADLLCCLVSHSKFPLAYAEKILDCIKFHITSQDGFIDNEEKRLASIMPILIDKGLGEHVVQNWIKTLIPRSTAEMYTDESYFNCRIIFNSSYFLTYLHYILKDKPELEALRKFIIKFEPTMWKLSWPLS